MSEAVERAPEVVQAALSVALEATKALRLICSPPQTEWALYQTAGNRPPEWEAAVEGYPELHAELERLVRPALDLFRPVPHATHPVPTLDRVSRQTGIETLLEFSRLMSLRAADYRGDVDPGYAQSIAGVYGQDVDKATHSLSETARQNVDILFRSYDFARDADLLDSTLRHEAMHAIERIRVGNAPEFGNDGPVEPDGFRWKGQLYTGLAPKPHSLLSVLWAATNRTVVIDDALAGLWGEEYIANVPERGLDGARSKANEFFRKTNIPLTVSKRRHQPPTLSLVETKSA